MKKIIKIIILIFGFSIILSSKVIAGDPDKVLIRFQ
jgi:hypothetical protein|tara:strand:+ start:142 stop:249 length:108 start_codon:yes stop_codon:yes gene_type:complete